MLNFTKISAQGMKLNSSEITVHLLFTKLYCTVLNNAKICLFRYTLIVQLNSFNIRIKVVEHC